MCGFGVLKNETCSRKSFPFFSGQVYEVKSQITLAYQDAPPKNTEQESMTAQETEFVPRKEDTTEKEFTCDYPLQNYDLNSCLEDLSEAERPR